jgi:hypothetical protein
MPSPGQVRADVRRRHRPGSLGDGQHRGDRLVDLAARVAVNLAQAPAVVAERQDSHVAQMPREGRVAAEGDPPI